MKIFKKLITLAIVAFLISVAASCSSSEPQINASGEKADAPSSSQMEDSAELAKAVPAA